MTGFFAVAAAAIATGYVAATFGLRPEPFYVGMGFVTTGLVLSVLVVRETIHHVGHEVGLRGPESVPVPTPRQVFARTTWLDRTRGLSRGF